MAREMKDSGIEWIGEIPKDWVVKKLLLGLRTPICDGPHETPDYVENGVPFISVDSLNESKTVSLENVKRYISEEQYNTYSIKAKLNEGDILFSKSATIGKTAIVNNEKFMVWSPLAIIKPNNHLYNVFLYYMLNCNELIKSIQLSGSYNTQANVGMREIEQSRIPFPSIVEQHRIASFLDSKCAEIDKAVETTKASIEEYKKLRQAIITEAVTKGLDPNVEMKDSGIEWIGEIPADWNVAIFSKLGKQIKDSNKGLVENNLLSLSYGRIVKKNIDTTFGLLPESFETYNIIEQNDIVLRLTDLQNDHKSLRVGLSSERGIITSAYIAVRLNDTILPKYMYYQLHSFDVCKGFYGMGAGVRQGLNWEEVKRLQIIVPSEEEQKEIVNFLEKRCSEIDSLIKSKEKLIEELTAYRKSLIYEYVTGKKEVPVEPA